MLLEHERNYDLGMDALVTVCSWNTNRRMAKQRSPEKTCVSLDGKIARWHKLLTMMLLLMIEILHDLRHIYIYILYIYVLVYKFYTGSCRMSTINSTLVIAAEL